VLPVDVSNKRGHLAGILMVNDAEGALRARSADQVTGFLNRLRPADLRSTGRPAAAASRINEEPSPGQLNGYCPARTPGGTRHQGNARAACLINHLISKHPAAGARQRSHRLALRERYGNRDEFRLDRGTLLPPAA